MGRIFSVDKIGLLTKVDNTHVQLPASIVTVGGQQYVTQSQLIINTGVSGTLGGLDTGAIAALSLYYVYGVVIAGTFGIVASLNTVSPIGFLSSRKLGWFTTDGSGNVNAVWPFNTRVAFRASDTSPTPDPWGNSTTQQIVIHYGGFSDYDTNLGYNSSVGYTIPQGYGGLWEFYSSIAGEGNLGTDFQVDIYIRVNGTPIVGQQVFAWSTINPGNIQPMTSLQWNCIPGDVISIAGLTNTTLGWNHNDAYNIFQGKILTEVPLI